MFHHFGLAFSPTTFLFVGRVDAEKKVDVLIRAIKLLNRKDIQLVVAGKGAALSGYQSLAHELGVSDQVHFTGFVVEPELPLLLNCIDVFRHAQRGRTAQHRQPGSHGRRQTPACGAIQTLPELVDDGVNGYLFEPGSVQDAARCMALLADHPEDQPRMGAASLEKVKAHSIDAVLKRYEDLYRGCLKGARAGARQAVPDSYR
ncbi:MAG: glycosyltransferase [Anaerolineaceae bacterium]